MKFLTNFFKCSRRKSGWCHQERDIKEHNLLSLPYTGQPHPHCGMQCKGNLTTLRRILNLDLAKGNPK
jgi:hypothetical protein